MNKRILVKRILRRSKKHHYWEIAGGRDKLGRLLFIETARAIKKFHCLNCSKQIPAGEIWIECQKISNRTWGFYHFFCSKSCYQLYKLKE